MTFNTAIEIATEVDKMLYHRERSNVEMTLPEEFEDLRHIITDEV